MTDIVCGRCGRDDSFSAPVAVMLIFPSAPGAKPFPLIPTEDYPICTACEMVFTFINRAMAANETANLAGPWTRAVIVLQDGNGLDVRPKGRMQKVALA